MSETPCLKFAMCPWTVNWNPHTPERTPSADSRKVSSFTSSLRSTSEYHTPIILHHASSTSSPSPCTPPRRVRRLHRVPVPFFPIFGMHTYYNDSQYQMGQAGGERDGFGSPSRPVESLPLEREEGWPSEHLANPTYVSTFSSPSLGSSNYISPIELTIKHRTGAV